MTIVQILESSYGEAYILAATQGRPWENILTMRHSHVIEWDSPTHTIPIDTLSVNLSREAIPLRYLHRDKFVERETYPQEMSLVNLGALLSCKLPLGGDFLTIELNREFLWRVASDLFHNPSLEFKEMNLFQDAAIFHNIATLHAELVNRETSNPLFVETVATSLVVGLLCKYGVSKRIPLKSSNLQISLILDFIEANITEPITLEDLAKIGNVSISFISHEFKKIIGYSPYQYITKRRVERAKKMLSDRQLPISEIATMSGFTDRSHFTKNFKALMGVTPKAYQKNI
jgi:AraC family transcriptional regulator